MSWKFVKDIKRHKAIVFTQLPNGQSANRLAVEATRPQFGPPFQSQEKLA